MEASLLEALVLSACDDIAPVLDEASVLHFAGSFGLSGDYQGRVAIDELFRRLGEMTEGTLRFSVGRTLVKGERAVVVLGHVGANRGRRRLDSDVVFVLSVKGDRLREIWILHSDQPHVDDFWMQPQADQIVP